MENEIPPDIATFLQEVKNLDDANEIHRALDLLYGVFDGQCLQGNFAYCNDVLSRVTVMTDFTPALHLGFLTISCAGRKRLPSRIAYYQRVHQYFIEFFRQEPQRVPRLLKGLGGDLHE